MDLEWKETEMEALNLADNALKGLKPDPAWDVSGVRDMAGGVIAVALVLCVGVIIIGCVSLIPGLVSNTRWNARSVGNACSPPCSSRS